MDRVGVDADAVQSVNHERLSRPSAPYQWCQIRDQLAGAVHTDLAKIVVAHCLRNFDVHLVLVTPHQLHVAFESHEAS